MVQFRNLLPFAVLATSLCAAPLHTGLSKAPLHKGHKGAGRVATLCAATSPEDVINAIIRGRIAMDIRAHATPVRVDGAFGPILNALSDKRLVGLGEGTHGTKEVVVMRGNLVLAMAKTQKVSVFMEDQTGAFAAINGWIHGQGVDADLTALMQPLFGIEKTVEFAQFLKNARAFNAKATDNQGIDIYGVDMQVYNDPVDNPIPGLQTWLAANGINMDADMATASAWIDAFANADPVTSTQRGQARASISKIFGAVSSVDHSVPGWAEAMVGANNLDRFAEFEQVYDDANFGTIYIDDAGNTPYGPTLNAVRDAAMATNIKILMDTKVGSTGKGVYWAHNAHIGSLSMLDVDSAGAGSAWSNTGAILHLWLGDAYAPVAFETGAGSFRSHVIDADGNFLPWQTVTAPAIPVDTLNAIAKSVYNVPVFFKNSDLSFMDFNRQELANGSTYEVLHPERSFVHVIPSLTYFATVTFPNSVATTALN